ncbi:MAG TPA: thiamine pyrophosphate-binding protein, partial [Myxococcota bacterium]|nr:thiamine pyrophosphate-binding protein [Myxococcota bacterium]
MMKSTTERSPEARAVDAKPALARNGAEVVCEALLAHGVSTLFGYCGGAILPFYDALLFYPQMHHIMVRHEQAAAHAAAGYARASGRPGVCVTTSGPGATNLLTGIMDARLDSTPMVILGGQVGTKLIGSDAFQETDMMCMTATITKHNYQPRNVEELEEVLHAAFHIAMTGRPGPVYIDLPKDVLEARTTRRFPMPTSLPGYRAPLAHTPEDIANIKQLLVKAQRPLLLVGGGAVHSDAGPALQRLAEQLQLPVASTIMAKGVISEDHPQCLGPIGMYGRKAAQHALMETDLLLAFGCRFSDRITGKTKAFAAHKTIVHVDIDAYELGKNVPAHLPVQGDVRRVTEALLEALADHAPSPSQRAWARRLGAARGVCERCVPHVAKIGVHPKRVMDAINAVKSDDDMVTTGVGQHQMFASHFLKHQKPRTFITSGGAGTMGYGLPAA